MLQKGFLKPVENAENTHTAKRSRILLVLGIVVVLSALVFMMVNLQDEYSQKDLHSMVTSAGIVMVVGVVLLFTGLWMNFFAQNRNRRKS